MFFSNFSEQIEEFKEHLLDKTDIQIKKYISNLTIYKQKYLLGTQSHSVLPTSLNCFRSVQTLSRSEQK